jgi:hypothetical protein
VPRIAMVRLTRKFLFPRFARRRLAKNLSRISDKCLSNIRPP